MDPENRERRAWIIVAGLSVVALVTLGASMPTIGMFLDPLSAEFEWTGAQTSRIATAFMMSFQVTAPLVGWLLERFRVKAVMAAGVVLVGLGYVAASMATDLLQLTVAMAIAGFGVAASTYIPSSVLVARWIRPERRALAIGLIIGTSSLGGGVFVPIVQYLIEVADWRVANQAIALSALLVALPIVLFLVREHPVEPLRDAPGERGDTALRTTSALLAPAYLWLVAMIMLANFALMGVFFHVVPFLTSVKFTAHTASALYASISISSFLGYIVVGIVADRIGAHLALLGSLALNAVSIGVLMFAGEGSGGMWPALFFVVVWGATVGASGQLLPILILNAMGPRRLSTLLGWAGLLSGSISALAPLATGALHDGTGSYALAFLLCAVITAVSLAPTVMANKARISEFVGSK